MMRAVAFAALSMALLLPAFSARADVVRLQCLNEAIGVHDTIDIDLARRAVLKVQANGKSINYEVSSVGDRFIGWRGEWSNNHAERGQRMGVEYRLDRATGLISWQYINPDGSGASDRYSPYQAPCKRIEGKVL